MISSVSVYVRRTTDTAHARVLSPAEKAARNITLDQIESRGAHELPVARRTVTELQVGQ